MDKQQRRRVQFSIVYVLLALLGIWIFQELIFRPYMIRQQQVPYSQFRADLAAGRINDVTLGQNLIYYTTQVDGAEETYNVVPVEDPELVDDLVAADVTFRAEPPADGMWLNALGWLIPLLPLALIWWFIFRRMGQQSRSILSIGRSKAAEITGELTGVTFEDVGGLAEVEVELKEIVDFLKQPERYTGLGAKLPKGVLLVGPPGTGKTLLARATAGQAGVPFFSLSGSDFVEMFVGVGAARVRDLFEQAKAKAPCIVFIDEIDAIGQSRSGAGAMRVNDEREQTLNQLLHEMDGFAPNLGVFIMAATNRPEVLDRALLRPGRFDRQVEVTLPTERGRRQILGIHTQDVPLAEDVDLQRLAQITPGFSGADLANIVNEAALMAVRHDHERVIMDDFDRAIERVVAGLRRKMPLSAEVRRKVAYHEGGHALVAELLPTPDQVHRVSIIPTSRGALGYTLQMPEEDQYLQGEQELKERMVVLLGGRAAELLIFDEPSTGAANDLERVTELARRMITEFGMTAALGPVRYLNPNGASYLGPALTLRPELSPETETLIDREVRRLVDEAQEQALDLLRTNESALHEIARVLQENEVINGEEIKRIAKEFRPVLEAA